MNLLVCRVSELVFLPSRTLLSMLGKQRQKPVLVVIESITVPTRVKSTVSVRLASGWLRRICEVDGH